MRDVLSCEHAAIPFGPNRADLGKQEGAVSDENLSSTYSYLS